MIINESIEQMFKLITEEKDEEALEVGLNTLVETSKNPLIWHNIGVAMSNLKQYEIAVYAFQKAIDLQPDLWLSYLGQSSAFHMTGNSQAGFAGYEYRYIQYYFPWDVRRDLNPKQWKGEDISGKTLFIYYESGFGDVVQYIRYVPYIKKYFNCDVILYLKQEWHCLFKNLNASIVSREQADFYTFDVQVYAMSLPFCMRTKLSNIPPPVQVDCCLRPVQGRIGIVWKAEFNPTDPKHLRSMKLDQLKPILKIPGFHFVCLQKVVSDEEANILFSLGVERPAIASYADTMRILETCERVISIDTGVAHLAASMEIPTWILLCYNACWRWLDGVDSHWYPAARLFRQRKQRVWEDPIQQVERELYQSQQITSYLSASKRQKSTIATSIVLD